MVTRLTGRLSDAAVAVLPTGEFVIAAAERDVIGDNSRVGLAAFDGEGSPLDGGATYISSSPTTGTLRGLSVAATVEGSVLVTYLDDNGARAAHSDIFGPTILGPVSNDTEIAFASDVAVVPLANGQFLSAYVGRDGDGVPAVFTQKLNADGTSDGGAAEVSRTSSASADDVALAASDTGRIAVLWSESGGGVDDTFVAEVDANGTVLTSARRFADSAFGIQTRPSAAYVAGSSRLRVVWDGVDQGFADSQVLTRELHLLDAPVHDSFTLEENRYFDGSEAWYGDPRSSRIRIGVADLGYAEQTDVPLPVLLDASFDYAKAGDGTSLRFYDADGTLLPYEIESWNAGGDSVVWVRKPTLVLDGSDELHMHYGGAPGDVAPPPTSVWSAGFDGVYHLDELTPDAPQPNATGGESLRVAGTFGTAGGGVLGGGHRFDGGDAMAAFDVPFASGTGGAAISGWFRSDDRGGDQVLAGVSTDQSEASRISLSLHDGRLRVTARSVDGEAAKIVDATTQVSEGTWFHAVASVDYASGEIRLYVDGTLAAGADVTFAQPATEAGDVRKVTVGRNEDSPTSNFRGSADEVRFHSVARSEEWADVQARAATGILLTLSAPTTPPSVAANDPVAADSIMMFGFGLSGAMNFSSDGTFVYRPEAGITGTEQFGYSVDQASGLAAQATVTLTIVEGPRLSLEGPATSLVVSTGSVTSFDGVSVDRIELNANRPAETVELVLSASSGHLQLGDTSALESASGLGGPVGTPVTLRGTAAAIQTALDGLTYHAEGIASDTLRVSAVYEDLGEVCDFDVTINVVYAGPAIVPEIVVVSGGDETSDLVFSAAGSSGGDGPLSFEWTVPGELTGTVEGANGERLRIDRSQLDGPQFVSVSVTVAAVYAPVQMTGHAVVVSDTPPVITPPMGELNLADRQELTFTAADLLATVSDIAADRYEVIDVRLNADAPGTLTPTAGGWTYAPGSSLDHLSPRIPGREFADVGLTYTVIELSDDGSDPTAEAISSPGTIRVFGVNDRPLADPPEGLIELFEDAVAFHDPLGDVHDPDGDEVTVVAVSGATHGLAEITASGGLAYRPDSDFSGTDRFTVTYSDGLLEMTRTYDVVVLPVNDDPEKDAVELRVREDTPHTFDPLAGASDADGNELSVSLATAPASGAVTVEPSGHLTYTPAGDFFGTDNFTYSISDGAGGEAIVAVSVTVEPVNDAPEILSGGLGVTENRAADTAGVIRVFDADGTTLTPRLLDTADAAFFVFDGETLRLADGFAADFETQSRFELTFAADDGVTITETTLPVFVQDVNETPVWLAAGPLVVAENFAGELDEPLSAADPEGAELTYVLLDAGGLPVTVDASTGRVSLSSPLDFEAAAGPLAIVVGVSDGVHDASVSVPLTLTDVAETPVIVAASYEIAENAIGPLGRVIASDPDGTTPVLSIVEGHGRFAIDAETGWITVSEPLDFETESHITLRVRAEDTSGLIAETDVSIRVSDGNDAPSGVAEVRYARPENAGPQTLGFMQVSDADGERLTYAISGPGAAWYTIDPRTGELSARSLDFESPAGPVHQFVVTAADGRGGVHRTDVRVDVIDVPELRIELSGETLVENAADAQLAAVVTLDAITATLPLSVLPGADSSGEFEVVDGSLLFARAIDFEQLTDGTLPITVGVFSEAYGLITATTSAGVVDVDEPVASVDDRAAAIVGLNTAESTLTVSRDVIRGAVVDPEGRELYAALYADGTRVSDVIVVTASGDLAVIGFEDVGEGTLDLRVSDRRDMRQSVTVGQETPSSPTVPDAAATPLVTGNSLRPASASSASDAAETTGVRETATLTTPAVDAPAEVSAAEIDAVSSSAPAAESAPPVSPAIAGVGQQSSATTSIAVIDGTGEAAEVILAAEVIDAVIGEFTSLVGFDVGESSERADRQQSTLQRQSVRTASLVNWWDTATTVRSMNLSSEAIATAIADPIWTQLDDVRGEMSSARVMNGTVERVALTVTSSMTIGYVLWTVRGGFLLTGLLAQVPAWRGVDPLSILDDSEEQGGEGESLASMVEASNRSTAGLEIA